MSVPEAFYESDSRYAEQIRQAIWGHLAPEKNRTYRGRIVYAIGVFSSDSSNPLPIVCDFEDLDSSPWFYAALQDWLQSGARADDKDVGKVFEWTGTFRNYKFRGRRRLLLNANKRRS